MTISFPHFRLMGLFEGGILDKMTNAEYEEMFGSQNDDKIAVTEQQSPQSVAMNEKRTYSRNSLQPVNLRILQGAFFVLFFGYSLGAIAFFWELLLSSKRTNSLRIISKKYLKIYKQR